MLRSLADLRLGAYSFKILPGGFIDMATFHEGEVDTGREALAELGGRWCEATSEIGCCDLCRCVLHSSTE